ncbi:MAG: hypothetical protein JWQ71_1828 [Pedosphaera sp.]|nr:hypothetical protein [Pedosphaera sp.]
MFYKIDASRISFREYWWGSPLAAIFVAWSIKLFRRQIPCSSDDPNVDSLQAHELLNVPLPQDVLLKFQPLIEELRAYGFHSPVFHEMIDPFHSTKIYFANFCHESGQTFARIHYRIWSSPYPPRIHLFPIFISSFTDGTYLVSTAGKADMAAPRTCRINRKLKAAPHTLWQSHQQELAKEIMRKAVVPVRNELELRVAMEKYHVEVRDFHLRRGVFKEMSGTEQQQATNKAESLSAYRASGLQHPEVMAELHLLQTKRAGWGGIITIFIVSLVLFLGFGAKEWSWEFTAMLVPILFIHELGHYLAMRIFRYRNLRMFFIPFLGAAVSGRNFNVPGWKKAIVSLMGPVPGIVLGVILGCVGMYLHKTVYLKVALVTLILNGSNLVPMLPFDGGWVMHAVLFSRHYVLDIIFRVLAALTLVIASAFLQTKALMYVGIATLVALPVTYKLARIAADLKTRDISPASTDDQTIPPATADLIIGEVKKAFPKGVTNKALAQHTLNIFENLNARPPNWLATIAFLFVHGGSVLLAIIFAMIFFVAKQGDLKSFIAAAAAIPQHKLACESVKTWSGTEVTGLPTAQQNTLVATFTRRNEAETAFQNFTNRLSANAAAKLFGESMLVTLPVEDDEARKKWLLQLRKQTTNVFVEITNSSTAVSVACIAPTEQVAKEVEEELRGYISVSSTLHLIPPWMPQDARSEEQRKQHRLARQTYAKLLVANAAGYKDPEARSLQTRMAQAQREGDRAELTKLRGEHDKMMKEASKRYIEKLKQEDVQKVDANLIDLYLKLPAERGTNWVAEASRTLGPRLGQLPTEADAKAEDKRYSSHWGSVSRNGLLLSISWVSFDHVFEGGPAFANWLCTKGCIDLKYDLQPGGFGFDDLGDEY